MSQTPNETAQPMEPDVVKVVREAEANGLFAGLQPDFRLAHAAEVIATTTLRSHPAVKEMLTRLARDAAENVKTKKEQKRITELQRILDQIRAREQQPERATAEIERNSR